MTNSRIFLAHASEDKPQVRELYAQLKERGLDPWLDVVDLIPGQNWRQEIPRAIKTAAVCLVCLSMRSIEKRSYVQREFRYALSAYADLPPDTIYLIPVRLDDCDVPDLQIAELALNLRDLHWVDLFDDDGFEKLVGAIGLNVKPSPKLAKKPPPKLKTVSPKPKPLEVFKDIDALWCPEMVLLPAGKFLMGSPKTEKGRSDNEGPQHEVRISEPFALGRYAVTFDEYDHFCEATGREKPDDRGWGRGRLPVINVSHVDAEAYCSWLSEVTEATYQLPSEAMWEYGCRAGMTTAYGFGDKLMKGHANLDDRIGRTSQVDAYPANDWGLRDMHGNVWEWCADHWHNNYQDAPLRRQRLALAPLRRPRFAWWVMGGRCAVRARGVSRPRRPLASPWLLRFSLCPSSRELSGKRGVEHLGPAKGTTGQGQGCGAGAGFTPLALCGRR